MASLVYTTTYQLMERSILEERAKGNYSAEQAWRDSCTKDTCPLNLSYWGYLPSVPANALFAALFGISLIGFITASIMSRKFLGFSIAMVSGSILEVLGYAGRIVSFSNPFNQNGFLIQIVCLTIGKLSARRMTRSTRD